MQPEMLFLCELAQGLTQRRVDRLIERTKLRNNNIGLISRTAFITGQQALKNIGKLDDMLFEAAPVVRAKMMIANNRQDWGQGG